LNEQTWAAVSPWVARWSVWLPPAARVLDVAAGSGRHARFLAARGHRVTAVDRDREALAAMANVPGIETIAADLEEGGWPFPQAAFDAVVVTCYLHRPLLPHLAAALVPGGLIIYETFMVGNEAFGRPSNPAFLLRPNELLTAFGSALTVLAFGQGYTAHPRPAMMQRLTARREAAP
jgi:SAM-dependent methyltransferase